MCYALKMDICPACVSKHNLNREKQLIPRSYNKKFLYFFTKYLTMIIIVKQKKLLV